MSASILTPIRSLEDGDKSARSDHDEKMMIGLTRSASRVLRFKSAKEFFERLSSINSPSTASQQQQQQQQQQYRHQTTPTTSVISAGSPPNHKSILIFTPERTTCGNVANRYTGPLEAARQQDQELKHHKHHQQQQQTILQPQQQPDERQQPLPVRTQQVHVQQQPQPRPPRQAAVSDAFASPPVAQRPRSLVLATTPTLPTSPFVRLNSTDHSSLSTNTILHINNSQFRSPKLNNNRTGSGNKFSDDSLLDGSPNIGECLAIASVVFSGDNVIIGNGSLLVRRNKQLKIKFDDSSTSTFEYPPEESRNHLLHEDEEEDEDEDEGGHRIKFVEEEPNNNSENSIPNKIINNMSKDYNDERKVSAAETAVNHQSPDDNIKWSNCADVTSDLLF